MKKYSEQGQPVRMDNRIQTVFITCDELDILPEWTIRNHLGPYKVMHIPGALLRGEESPEHVALQELLSRNSGIKHVVMCQHSLCTKFIQNFSGSKRSCHNDLNAEYRRLLWQQQSLRNAVPAMKQWLADINRGDIQVHGWIYESETDWISALDSDCEHFVPLNAHTHFHDRLMIK